MDRLTSDVIDFSQQSFYISAISIIFNPLFWNIVARQEYKNKALTRLFGGNSRYACYALALSILSLGVVRDGLYERALRHQPSNPAFEAPYLAYMLLAVGNVLVLSSFYRLGFVGTFLGDYFGYLMDEPVTGFPFNVTGAPMYWGSSMSFMGSAILYGRPAGVVLTSLVIAVYWSALKYEDPFTAGIYAKRAASRDSAAKGTKKVQ